MPKFFNAFAYVAYAFVFSTCALGHAVEREYVNVVSSSELGGFSQFIANDLNILGKVSPQVDSVSSNMGIDLLCSGTGLDTPDLLVLSRSMTDAEKKSCRSNNVTPLEIELGKDAAVLVNANTGQPINLTAQQLYMAFAKYVPNDTNKLILNSSEKWSDIDPALPDSPIVVYGPEWDASATRALIDGAIEPGCQSFDQLAKLEEANPRQYEMVCRSIRKDGVWRSVSNSDMAIRSVVQNQDAWALIWHSELSSFSNLISPVSIGFVEPSFESIEDGTYSLSQGVFLYVKKQHVSRVPNVEQVVNLFLSDEVLGEDGALSSWGVVPVLSKTSSWQTS